MASESENVELRFEGHRDAVGELLTSISAQAPWMPLDPSGPPPAALSLHSGAEVVAAFGRLEALDPIAQSATIMGRLGRAANRDDGHRILRSIIAMIHSVSQVSSTGTQLSCGR